MTTPTTAELLKYADLQMAAEAFLVTENGTLKSDLQKALTTGNDHSSKFTDPQATNFLAHWEVVAQKADTSTGFSGTLFKCILSDPATGAQKDQLVMSFRSTEFIDDAARDNQATNNLEIRKTGFAWGQISDMEDWYASLVLTGKITQPFSVTGYSLGGHLATAFNLLHPTAAQQTVTFNGAGVGQMTQGSLSQTLAEFNQMRGGDTTLIATKLNDSVLVGHYNAIRTGLTNATMTYTSAQAYLDAAYAPTGGVSGKALELWRMLGDMETIADLAVRVSNLQATDSTENPPTLVAATDIAALNLDYRMAVYLAGQNSKSAYIISGAVQAFGDKAMLGIPVGNTALANQFDVVGASSPSMVSHSQWHYGKDVRIGIEDQPLYRGGIVLSAADQSWDYGNVELLVNGYDKKDFGDTHSLVLLVDSLNVQNTLLQMLPPAQRADAGATLQTSQGAVGIMQSILGTASNRVKTNGDAVFGSGQGKAEGDVLENVLNALADLVLGPTTDPTKRLKGAPDGGTWALTKWPVGVPNPQGYTTRTEFYHLLSKISTSVKVNSFEGKFTIAPAGGSSLATDARTDFAAYAALYSLSPFVLKLADASQQKALFETTWGPVYTDWATTGTHTSTVSDQWLKDRAALLERKNYFNTVNASYDSTDPNAWGAKTNDGLGNVTAINTRYDYEDTVWKWKEGGTDQTIQRGGVTGKTRYVVFGGEGDDTIASGNGNSDHLYGGLGNDTYQFTGSWGKDTVCDLDGKGRITIDGQSIGFAQAIGTPGNSTWSYEISPGVSVFLKVVVDARSSNGKSLVITKGSSTATSGDPANSITIQNFDLVAAKDSTGYLGIKLDPAVKVATLASGSLPIGQGNFFNTHGADATALAGQGSNVLEGTGKSITVYLNQAAKAGETAVLSLQNLASAGLKAILGDSVVNAEGATITLVEGQTQVSFALIQDGTLSADVSGSVSVTYNGAAGSVTSNAWGLNIKDTGVATKTYNGDYWIKTTTQQGSPIYRINANGDAVEVVAVGEQSYASDFQGNLQAGSDAFVVDNTLFGGDDRDLINGLTGNDALSGGAGNDTIDGGIGNDLIGGGSGSDNIKGGDGDDFISSSGNMPKWAQQYGPNDTWSTWGLQANTTVIGQGATWGIYPKTGADGLVETVWSAITSISTASDEGDVVDAGAGNDYVMGSWSDDRIQGGDGKDNLEGLAGDDIIEGGTGDDTINGDGIDRGGYLDSVDAAHHGNDFIDGGAGNDEMVGNGGSDVIYGGADNDRMWGDASIGRLALASHGNDYMDGEDGDDFMEGGGKDDTLYGGAGSDTMLGDTNVASVTNSADNLLIWGNDYLDGEDGNDQIVGGGKDDTLYGGAGDDKMWGDAADAPLEGSFNGNDYLDGEDGNDQMVGGGKDDTLFGGNGNDLMLGDDDLSKVAAEFQGSDYMDGEAGNDTLIGGGGDDTLLGGSGDDILDGGTGADYMDGGTGNNTYVVDNIGDVIVDARRADSAPVTALTTSTSMMVAAATVTTATSTAPTVTTSVQASISYTLGNNLDHLLLIGTANIDGTGNAMDNNLWGNVGNNVLAGGAGSDYLTGGAGNDVYVFNLGDGTDTIDNTDFLRDTSDLTKASAVDILRFGAGIADTDVIGSRLGDNLYLKIKGTTDQVFVAGYYGADLLNGTLVSDHKIDRVEFTNGVVWDQAKIQNVVDQAANNHAPTVSSSLPTLQARVGSIFSYTVPVGTITDPDAGDSVGYSFRMQDGSAVPGWLNFDAATRTFSGTPDAGQIGTLKLMLLGTDNYDVTVGTSVTLDVQANHAPTLVTPLTDQAITQGAEFSYTVSDTTFNETDVGDTLTYSATLADGSILPAWLSFDAQTRRFSGMPSFLGTISVKVIATDTGNLSSADVFDILVQAPNIVGTSGDDTLNGGGGDDILRGLGGNDLIYGNSGNDYLDGGIGNDTLYGGSGKNTYFFARGSGRDVIETADSPSGFHRIEFASDVLPSEMVAIRTGNDLVLSFAGTTDQVSVSQYFSLAPSLYEVHFLSDGTLWNGAAIAAQVATHLPSDGDNILVGTVNSESISGYGGNDTIFGYGGNDTLYGDAGDDVLIGGTGNDKYYVDSALDVVIENLDEGIDTVESSVSYTLAANVENLTLVGYSSSINGTGNAINNVLIGSNADNILSGGAGDDILDGGIGNDTLNGGTGDDKYYVGSALDVVTEYANEGVDYVESTVSFTLSANVENLTLMGTSALNGSGNAGNNVLIGNSAANTLTGGAGDDTLDGMAGTDTLVGGVGNDTYFIDSLSDVMTENMNEGTDTVVSAFDYTLGNNFENLTLTGTAALLGTGNALNNLLTGNSADNVLNGGAGVDTLKGGAGNDTYVVDVSADVVIEDVNAGIDQVQSSASYTLGANVENLTLTGTAAINGTGNSLNNFLTGNSASNVLTGGGGDDTYVVTAGDTIIENTNEGIDSIQSALTYSLGANLENLTLTGIGNINGTGNVLNNTLIGNAGANVLTGGAGDDVLNGVTGTDTLIGGTGNDYYVIDDSRDVITENANEGTDTVETTYTYTLGATLENLVLAGNTAINGTGNGANNRITGNSLANLINGGLGADTMLGGNGDDTYIVDNLGDVVTENAGGGTDTVQSSVTYSLSGNVENLTLTGTAAVNGTGNGLNNVLTGNSANNVLAGGGGDDTYVVTVGDTIIENADEGIDTVQSALTYTLALNLENLTLTGTAAVNGTGNSRNNVLTGNSAANVLTGGLGDDTYVIGSGDTVIEAANEGVDTVQSSITYTLSANLENLTLVGTTAINATGNSANNILTGNSAANVLTGGAGDDLYIIGAGDTVAESINNGTDTVQSSVSHTLGANLENLTLTGTTAINGTGNGSNNVLLGNSANNTIDGGVGVDTMIGGLGDDNYIVDNLNDVVIENANEGTDTVQSYLSYQSGGNIENITLLGTSAINATGDATNNVLTGNSAANVLTGAAGNDTLNGAGGSDTLNGGTGDDTYIVSAGGTLIIENLNEGTDSVQSSVSYTLDSNVENLTLTGIAAINATGNSLANVITGNDGNNVIDGGAGIDFLSGGGGNDTLIGTANDMFSGGTGDDLYVIQGGGYVEGTYVRDGYMGYYEASGAGIDTIQTDGSTRLYKLEYDYNTQKYIYDGNIENATLTGTSNSYAYGNSSNNVLIGNSGNNLLQGLAGNDRLDGGDGNDTLLGGAGTDTLIGGAGDDLLNGGDGSNWAGGVANMSGGQGNDRYYVYSLTDSVTENSNEGIDTVESNLSYTLGSNVENLELGRFASSANGTGNGLNNVITGNASDNVLSGLNGNDTLDGGAGADSLIGGTGDDTYKLGRGYGIDTVTENDATVGNTDVALFGAGVTDDQLWFTHVGNNLEVSIIGTSDKLVMQNWYLGNQYHVEQIKVADGHVLLDSKVQNLVQAMAAFAPPAAGQTTLSAAYQTTLNPVIAANWV